MMPHRRAKAWLTTTLLCLAPGSISALDLAWPEDATLVDQETETSATHLLATGVFDGSVVPTTRVEGQVSQQVWQISGDLSDPGLLIASLRGQLAVQGFDITFSCAAPACGGFDFRYALPIADGPAMHVDLGNFHYLTARRDGPDGPVSVALTTSHGGLKGYAHLTVIGPAGEAPVVTGSTRAPVPDPIAGGELIETLLRDGRSPLDDLVFETGASALSGTHYASLVALSEFLSADPARRVVLVGHTDTQGSLDSNVALSNARATAVRSFIIDELGAPGDQIEARGIGYLAPRAPNATAAGRQANRRVEVVLIAP